MPNLITRLGIHRHAYQAGAGPVRVVANAFTATAATPAGPALIPLSSPLSSYAADGAPFYNSGYMPGYPSRPLGWPGVPLRLPPRAAQVDLTDLQSWDRPVQWTGGVA